MVDFREITAATKTIAGADRADNGDTVVGTSAQPFEDAAKARRVQPSVRVGS
jgi:hypothetical protein